MVNTFYSLLGWKGKSTIIFRPAGSHFIQGYANLRNELRHRELERLYAYGYKFDALTTKVSYWISDRSEFFFPDPRKETVYRNTIVENVRGDYDNTTIECFGTTDVKMVDQLPSVDQVISSNASEQ